MMQQQLATMRLGVGKVGETRASLLMVDGGPLLQIEEVSRLALQMADTLAALAESLLSADEKQVIANMQFC